VVSGRKQCARFYSACIHPPGWSCEGVQISLITSKWEDRYRIREASSPTLSIHHLRPNKSLIFLVQITHRLSNTRQNSLNFFKWLIMEHPVYNTRECLYDLHVCYSLRGHSLCVWQTVLIITRPRYVNIFNTKRPCSELFKGLILCTTQNMHSEFNSQIKIQLL
jgi:hypothetical protein